MPSKPAGEGCHSYSNSRLPLWYSIEGKGPEGFELDTLTGYGKIAASMAEPFGNVTLFVDMIDTNDKVSGVCVTYTQALKWQKQLLTPFTKSNLN